jgi:hypothetical protein
MITLRFDGEVIKYCEISKTELLEDEWVVNYLTDEKVAGRIDNPLTYTFIKELLTKDEEDKDS